MPDWNTRLEVKVGDTTISPISSFNPTFNTPHTVIHSIEAENVGYVRQPFTYTFTMTVPAIGTAVADLTELAVNGTEFAIAVAEKKGTDWAFKSIKFSQCIITSASPSNVVVDGMPTASFNCMALNVSLEAQVAFEEVARPEDRRAVEKRSGLVTLPGYRLGGRVDRTGIALVHEGEYIVPAPGSEAEVSAASAGAEGLVLNFYFPAEIEVVGELSESQVRRVAEHVFEELNQALASRV